MHQKCSKRGACRCRQKMTENHIQRGAKNKLRGTKYLTKGCKILVLVEGNKHTCYASVIT